jgi:hypothetical protein
MVTDQTKNSKQIETNKIWKTLMAILFLLTVALTPPLQADPKTEKIVIVFGMS